MNVSDKNSKTQFLATTVHEIRTPVQTIIGILELLKETNLDKEQSEYLRQLQFSADVLLNLSNNVLDFSKIQSGKFELEYIPFSTIKKFEQISDLICIEAHNKNIEVLTEINYNIPQVIISDPTRIQQILLNLLKNAVKFTKEGHIRLFIDSDSINQKLIFKVEDTGIGIPEENKDKIFTEYYQANKSTTRVFGGTGLGLPICKKITELMHGTIEVATNSYGGTTFTIEIPYSIPENHTIDKSEFLNFDSTSLQNDKKNKILIVDDYKESLTNIKNKLNFLGYHNIETATSGYIALERLNLAAEEKDPFEFVFIDISMPGMDGWHLASEINNNKKINNSKLFLLSPEENMGKEAKMKMLGWFNDYLYKPIKISNLYNLLIESEKEIVDLEVVNEDLDLTKYRKIKILVAEDHPVNRKLITTFLKNLNSEIIEAENGKEVIDIIKENADIDIIFMDIQMPFVSGIEATKTLRKNLFDGIIIACTANTDTRDFKEYQKAGMNDILVKPFKKQDITNILSKWDSVINLSATQKKRRKKYEFIEKLDLSQNHENIWDKIDFLDTVSNDIDFAQKLIIEYISQTRILLIRAKESLYHNNFEELASIAHTLKGSSSTISAKSLYNTAYQIERYSKEKNINEVINSISKFSALFSLFIEEAKSQEEAFIND